MSSAEIEDVLSSIRRLVTEDVRSQTVHRIGTATVAPATAASALVLTPAQRVADIALVQSAERPWTEAEPHLEPDASAKHADDVEFATEWPAPVEANVVAESPITSLERTISELEAAVAGIQDEFEPDVGESLSSGEDPSDFDAAFHADEDRGQFAEQEAEGADLTEGPHTSASYAASEPTEGRDYYDADEVEDLNASSGATQVEEDQFDDGVEPGLDTALTEGTIAGVGEYLAPSESEIQPGEPHEDDLWLADAGDEPTADTDGAAEHRLALGYASRLHLSASMEVPRESDDAADGVSGETRPSRIKRSEASETATESTSGNMFQPAEEAVIDADALRDLVVEIIRQELQGALGERITRNVRKLVRREINRVLDTRGLE